MLNVEDQCKAPVDKDKLIIQKKQKLVKKNIFFIKNRIRFGISLFIATTATVEYIHNTHE